VADFAGSSTYFYMTLVDSSATREIVKVTTHTLASDSFTVVRAQDDTIGASFLAGDVVELRLTAAMVVDLQTQIDSLDTRVVPLETHAAATGTAVHGLGTISTQNANAVAITGGTVSGISGSITIDNEAANVSIKSRDHNQGTTPENANVIFGTGSPPTASTVPLGTLFFKYV
jgi:hypothetical protein